MKKPIACIIILIFIISMFSFFIPKLIARNFPPVAYWNFDEGTGNIAHDSSGNGNVGTLVSPQWVNGVSGNAVNFDGFNDYLSVPTSSSLAVQGNAMSLECWIKPGMKIDDGVNRIISIIDKGDEYTFQINPNDGRIWFAVILSPGLNWQGITTAISSWTAGTWYHIVGTYDGSYLRIYVKGILSNSRTLSGNLHPPTSFPFTIGAHSLGFDCNFNGIIDEVKVYNYARAPEQVMEDYVAVINPSEEVLGGYWAFDEGSGEFAYDSSGNENTGTLMNGPQWVKGISGTALYFDGINDWVRIPHSSSLDFTGNQMSIEFWMKLENDWYPGVSSVNPIIFCKGDALCVAALLGNTGSLRFNLPYLEPYTNSDKTNWKTDTWYHIAGVFTGSQIIIYINGEVDTAQPLTGSVPRSTLNAAIGAHCFGGKDFFNGVIDEVAIYDYARAAEDIQNDFNSVAENPVGYWKFDEGSGTVAGDSSGNGNTGTLMNGPQWVNGVSGKALKLDGINDYVYVPHSSSLDIVGNEISVEYWIKLSTDWYAELEKDYTYDQIIYDKGDAYTAAMIKKSGAHRFNIPYVPPYPETNKNHWDANTWYHLANVFDGTQIRIYVNGVLDNVESVVGSVSRSTINLAIGSHCFGGKHFFNGAIDEFAIYDYARTAEEIWNDAHVLPRKPFDPILNGFGFQNYGYNSATCSVHRLKIIYDEFESALPNLEIGPRMLLSMFAWAFDETVLRPHSGHCYGMSTAALYYYLDDTEIMNAGYQCAYDIKENDLESTASFAKARIETYQHSVVLDPSMMLRNFVYTGFGVLNLEEQRDAIINAVDQSGYALVTFKGKNTTNNKDWLHEVLVFNYEEITTKKHNFYCYDSNKFPLNEFKLEIGELGGSV
ncbi:MAG: LamG domain-containing protein, partial [Candidatus Bathyarchaeota archaeon]|nr:LamG domain-containing protein [Candidatus Bathyarchaeota archaeon]